MRFRKSLALVLLLCTTAGSITIGQTVTRHVFRERQQLTDATPRLVSVDAIVSEPMGTTPLQLAYDSEFARPSYWTPETSTSTAVIALPACFSDSNPDELEVTAAVEPAPNDDVPPAPQPLPLLQNALDISRRSDSEDAARIVREAMPDATDADRAIWLNQLEGMSPDEIRFLMNQRQRLGATLSVDLPVDPGMEPTTQPALETAPSADQTAAAILNQNLANTNTIGYRQRVVLYSARRDSTGRTFSLRIDHTPGRLLETGRHLDLAIDGPGFFCLSSSSGKSWYCRSAPFVFRNGQVVLDENETDDPLVLIDAIPADAREIRVERDGRVSVEAADNTQQAVGRIRLARFLDASQLHPVGQSLFVASRTSGAAQLADPNSESIGRIIQGRLEQSNVDHQSQRDELKLLQSRQELTHEHPLPTDPVFLQSPMSQFPTY